MLVVTIHDVAPATLGAVRRLRDAARGWGAAQVTLLAIPDHHRRGRLSTSREATAWLRGCVAGGDEVALHGYHHRQDGPVPGAIDRLRAAALTAGEGEMLAMPPAIRADRLRAGRAEIEDVVGGAVAGFVAPAWLEPRGLGAVLAELGFAWHETAMVVEALGPGPPRRLRAPVIGFATRSWWREAAARAWARALTPALDHLARRGGLARVALHPGDLASPAVMAAAAAVIGRLAARHPAVTTAAALATAGGASAGSRR